MDEFQRRLEAAFQPIADGETIRGVSEGILLADDVIENTPILRHAGGRDLRGHIRRSGIIFRLHDFCEKGGPPILCRNRSNASWQLALAGKPIPQILNPHFPPPPPPSFSP